MQESKSKKKHIPWGDWKNMEGHGRMEEHEQEHEQEQTMTEAMSKQGVQGRHRLNTDTNDKSRNR